MKSVKKSKTKKTGRIALLNKVDSNGEIDAEKYLQLAEHQEKSRERMRGNEFRKIHGATIALRRHAQNTLEEKYPELAEHLAILRRNITRDLGGKLNYGQALKLWRLEQCLIYLLQVDKKVYENLDTIFIKRYSEGKEPRFLGLDWAPFLKENYHKYEERFRKLLTDLYEEVGKKDSREEIARFMQEIAKKEEIIIESKQTKNEKEK